MKDIKISNRKIKHCITLTSGMQYVTGLRGCVVSVKNTDLKPIYVRVEVF